MLRWLFFLGSAVIAWGIWQSLVDTMYNLASGGIHYGIFGLGGFLLILGATGVIYSFKIRRVYY